MNTRFKTVELFNQNKTVTFDEAQTPYIDEPTSYECYITTTGEIIAYDEAICDWVQIGYVRRK